MKFADLRNDVAFRKILGNKRKTHILISLLNAVLQLQGDQRIASIKIEDPNLFPRLAGEKSAIIDVRATEESGRQFVIEMQVTEPRGFDKRVQYYASRDYSMQINKGQDYSKLKPTVFIGILDFNYFKGHDYLSYHSLLDEKTYESKLKDLRFAFIELKKFKKSATELTTLVDKWIFFIKNSEKLADMPDNIEDEGLKDAYFDADRHHWTKSELIAYDNSSIAVQDAIGRQELAVERAVERAEKDKALEIAKNLKALGVAVADIAKATGLDEEEIEGI